MWIKRIGVALAAIGITAWMAGCNGTHPKPGAKTGESGLETVARVHWMGKKNLASNPTATNLMSIWNLPESARLEAQTVGKLSRLPLRLFHKGSTNEAHSSSHALLVQPLIQDIVEHESHFEAARSGAEIIDAALAVKVGSRRAEFWMTNLTQALNHLTGIQSASAKETRSWTLQKAGCSDNIQCAANGEWIILGVGTKTNPVFGTLNRNLKSKPTGVTLRNSKAAKEGAFLDCYLSRPLLAKLVKINRQVTKDLPAVELKLISTKQGVRTVARIEFEHVLDLQFPEWNVPTNLVHDPLTSFVAARGFGSWVSSWPLLKKAGLTSPNQGFMWGLGSIPFLTYAAAPTEGRSITISQLSDLLIAELAPVVAQKRLGKIETNPGIEGASLTGFPFLRPRVEAMSLPEGEFLFAGFAPLVTTNLPAPIELLQELQFDPKLIYYQWEVTAAQVEPWVYLSQLFRVFGFRTQVPASSAAMTWLKAATPRMGNCVTRASVVKANEITLARSSAIGLNALELQLLTDWLEAESFPCGLYSLETKGQIDQHKARVTPGL